MPFVETDSDRIERVLLGAGYALQRVRSGLPGTAVPWTLRLLGRPDRHAGGRPG